jgi:hypothetical protein
MRGRRRALVGSVVVLAVLGGLVLAFPRAAAFAELAARELRYFWWLVLIVALAGCLIWGFRRDPDK